MSVLLSADDKWKCWNVDCLKEPMILEHVLVIDEKWERCIHKVTGDKNHPLFVHWHSLKVSLITQIIVDVMINWSEHVIKYRKVCSENCAFYEASDFVLISCEVSFSELIMYHTSTIFVLISLSDITFTTTECSILMHESECVMRQKTCINARLGCMTSVYLETAARERTMSRNYCGREQQ